MSSSKRVTNCCRRWKFNGRLRYSEWRLQAPVFINA